MNKYVRFITQPQYRFNILCSHNMLFFSSDKRILDKKFKYLFGRNINWNAPKTFNEKLQWLKLYDRRPEYTTMVDKYAVKKYVADKIGNQYIIPTLGVWDSYDAIDFESLPEQFVLKCTHDSGSAVICRNKSAFDFEAARRRLGKCLKRNYFYSGREWPYKNVKPRIIAEQYMSEHDNIELTDYKFYCFGGTPEFLYISKGLEDHSTAHISYLTLDWKQADFYREDYPAFDTIPPKPVNFEQMVEFAELFSKDIPFLRVDFYEINSNLYFSELTFYPGSGFTKFIPESADLKLGDMLKLPPKKRINHIVLNYQNQNET